MTVQMPTAVQAPTPNSLRFCIFTDHAHVSAHPSFKNTLTHNINTYNLKY